MKETKTIYKCDRCKAEISKLPFEFFYGTFKTTMSATEYEQVKYGYLPRNKVPLPDEKIIILKGICGYESKGLNEIHLCSKCTRDFKKFMRRKIDE